MKTHYGINVGWIDASIGSLLQRDAQLPQRFHSMLVTSIDSNRHPAQLREVQDILRKYPECRILGTGLLTPSNSASKVSTDFNLFTGFDEVWWFDEEPSLAKPEEFSLVAPLNLGVEEIPASLAQWMQNSKCTLGLGDGIGLNFATPDAAIASMLETATAN